MKRPLELLLALLGVVLLGPIMIVTAAAVRCTSRGPVLFRQERVGLRGRPFRITKFRTMRTGARGPRVTASRDPRITGIGKCLRATKLDETPQLFNVIRGDMSLVGPRPELAEFADQWPAGSREIILSIRPGITDPASIEYRREEDELAACPDPQQHYIEVILPRKAAHYVAYVQSRSLRGDCAILARTLRAVLVG